MIGRKIRLALKYLLGLAFAAAGANHFIHTGFYASIMPPYLPWHALLIYLSGFCAIALGVALLVPRFTRDGAIWYTPRSSPKAAAGVLYPDMGNIKTLGAYY